MKNIIYKIFTLKGKNNMDDINKLIDEIKESICPSIIFKDNGDVECSGSQCLLEKVACCLLCEHRDECIFSNQGIVCTRTTTECANEFIKRYDALKQPCNNFEIIAPWAKNNEV